MKMELKNEEKVIKNEMGGQLGGQLDGQKMQKKSAINYAKG